MPKVKHVVPFLGVARPGGTGSALHTALQRVKRQLNLDDKETKPASEQQLDLIQFPQTAALVLPDYKPIGRFTFNKKAYIISEDDLKKAPSDFPESKFFIFQNIKNEKICTNYKELKGTNNDLYSIAMARGLTKQKPLHKCKWFVFNYWHSSTYVGKIIKSRPGILIVCHNHKIFNTETTLKGKIPSDIQNTSYPFKFAVYRSKLKKLMRKHFLNLYLKNMNFAKTFDGLYNFSCSMYPRTNEELTDFIQNLQICIDNVSQLDLNKIQKLASKDNAKIPWYEVRRVFSRNNMNMADVFPESIKQKSKNKKIKRNH